MIIICMMIAFLSCIIGSVCGIGGGIIIKPLMDAMGMYNVVTINFMSCCTVLGMSAWNVGKTLINKEASIDFRKTTYLAFGAAVGGMSGKRLFAYISSFFAESDMVGGIQAGILLVATFATFLYTLGKDNIQSRHVKNSFVCVAMGFCLGNFGAFLGIGGGPFNIALLYHFFSMTSKMAAQNSLYIIVFSQTLSFVETLISEKLDLDISVLLLMMLGGILGSEFGGWINKKISEVFTTKLFLGIMIIIMLLNTYNIIKFLRG